MVKLVRFFLSLSENFFEVSKWIERGFARRRQPQSYDLRFSRIDFQHILCSKFRPDVLWIYGVVSAMHDAFVKRIFHEPLSVWIIVNARRIRFILSKERLGIPLIGELIIPKHIVLCDH